jgi:hypothetical protein
MPQARQILKKLLAGPIQFQPTVKETSGSMPSKRPSRWIV